MEKMNVETDNHKHRKIKRFCVKNVTKCLENIVVK